MRSRGIFISSAIPQQAGGEGGLLRQIWTFSEAQCKVPVPAYLHVHIEET